MSCVRLASLLVFATGLSATGLAAEPATQSIANGQSTTSTTPPPPAVARSVSPGTAAKLSASAPKFVATPTTTQTTIVATDEAKNADTSNPRNTIVRLPEYVVRDPRTPAIKEREVLTPRGRLELARKLHPGVRVGNFFGLNNGVALAMLAEQERLERKREFEELANLVRFGDPSAHSRIKHEVDQAFMRERDFGR